MSEERACACGGRLGSLGHHNISMDIDTFLGQNHVTSIYSKDLPVEIFQCDRCGEIRLFRSQKAAHLPPKNYEDLFESYTQHRLQRIVSDPSQSPRARQVARKLLEKRRKQP